MLDQLREAFPQIDWQVPQHVNRTVFGHLRGYTLEVSWACTIGEGSLYYAYFSDPEDGLSINLSGGEAYDPVSAVLKLQKVFTKYSRTCEAFDVAFPGGLRENPKEKHHA